MRSIQFMPRRPRFLGAVGAAVILAAGTAAAVQATTSARAAPAQRPACAHGTTVQTATGPVCGITANGLDEWLGIPYAAPPVGSLRWQSPQPHAPWATVLPATTEESPCPQGTISTDEDCLYVDVYAPAGALRGSLPVLVHIHGGGFLGGSNSVYDKTKLASQGHMVVVGIQYRLGILGFLADSAFGPHAGDYGLQDQQAALRWVQQNIAAFGGDPRNVTILGDSAGGSSMCDQIASPTAAGLFARAVSISGEYNSLLGPPTSLQPQDCKAVLPTETQAGQDGAAYAASLGCSNPATVAACLRAAPVSKLLSTPGGTLAPIINGTTLTMQLQRAFSIGAVNRVTAMMGVDRDENLTGTPTTPAQYAALIKAQYGAFAPRVLALYPLALFPSPYEAYRTVAADSDTVCPGLVTDQRLSRHIPVFAWVDYNADAPLLSFFSPAVANGAGHVAELPFLFPGVFGAPATLDADQQALAGQYFAEVTSFARTGNPAAPGTPPWPRFTAGGRQVMTLQAANDSEIRTAADIGADHNCQFWDAIAPKF
ncbi:MAG TPA: carboxylesterase family protein [Streptosporangiaceae bacterium]|nr:carboxylesterase family protein [Streptosporangiaceae bacterium]